MKKNLIFTILLMSVTLIHAEGVNLTEDKQLTCQQYYPICETCTKDQFLLPFNKFSSDPDTLEVESDESEIIDNDNYLISGNVVLKSDSHFLSADKIKISVTDQSSKSSGNVKYQDKNFFLISDQLDIQKENDGLIINIEKGSYQEIETKANGSAKFIRKTPNSAFLEDSTYSFCPINNNQWFIKADTIDLDLNTYRAKANKATLVFYGFPIFYLPRYSWVAKGRGSGFLTPSFDTFRLFGEEKSDYQIRIPYYFNIAPDKDLVLALSYLSNRGATYEGKYRQLIYPTKSQDDGLFEFEFQFLNNDHVTNLNRWLVNTSVELDLNEKMHLSMLYNKVSDKDYFKEISRANTAVLRLNSHVKFNYNNPPLPLVKLENGDLSGKIDKEKIMTVNDGRNTIGIGDVSEKNHLSFSVMSEDEQVVNSGTPGYVKNLETSIFSRSSSTGKYGSKLDLSFISTNFDHETEDQDTGIRNHGEVNFEKRLGTLWPISFSQLSAKTKLGLSHYSLDNKSNEKRVIGSFDLDLSFPFYNETNLFGTAAEHQLIPKISYDYTSKKEQSAIPIFDTKDEVDKILTYAALLSGERYKGVDRFVNENDITVSLQSSYTDKITGDSILNFSLAQRYYGDDEVVSDEADTNFETRRKYSDIVASLDMSINDFISNTSIQYDPQSASIAKKGVSFSYIPHPRKFIALDHVDDGTTKSLELSGSYPINNRIHIFAGIDKDLSSGIISKETTGIAYEACCWAARIAHFKQAYVEDNVPDFDYSTGFELVFKGLGTTDSYIRNKIKVAIPKYKVNLD